MTLLFQEGLFRPRSNQFEKKSMFICWPWYLSPKLVHGDLLGIEEEGAGIDAFAPAATLGKLGAVGTAALCARAKHVGSREPGFSGTSVSQSVREPD